MHKTLRAISICLLCCLATPATAATTALLLKDDTLRSKPFLDAPKLASLKRGSSVTVIKRQGTWSSVQGQATKGWVRSLSLKTGAKALKGGSLATLNTGRLGSGRIVSTTGIRGLNEGSEENLKKAEFDGDALAALEAQAVSTDTATAFARQGKLKKRSLSWLEAK